MKQHPLYLLALEPTHVGAGGYRLGRVDNTILRDAGTGLPKVPGSSLNGATRAAAVYSVSEVERGQAVAYARMTIDEPNANRGDRRGGHDPVAKFFGYAEGDKDGSSRIGCVSFHDAEVLAFPVPTASGPRWITTTERLVAAGCYSAPEVTGIERVLIQQGGGAPLRVNLGWYLLNADPADIPLPAALLPDRRMQFILGRLVIVHPDLFPSLVNGNLETRTSVAIDFETGAAAENLLFTYEATPRGTLFLGQIDFDDDRFPDLYMPGRDLVQRALRLACSLGLGGMTTRGFGSMTPLLMEATA